MRSVTFYLVLSVLLACTMPAAAKITLPSFFSDGMVLQQKSNVKIWGNTDSKHTISIQTSWDGRKYAVQISSEGNWTTSIKTPVAGGPFSITVSDGEAIMLNNILIGEVWLASGQSNMEMPLKGFDAQPVNNSDALINEAANSQIRFFVVKNNSWRKPLTNCGGQWQEANAQTRPDFSATAYLFARELQAKLNVPVGILEADWGGTMIQPWMSRRSLSEVSPETRVFKDRDTANIGKNAACGLFNAMINPIVGYSIKGAIWYQGEQNRPEPELYARLFPAMVKQWRNDWGQGNFPFYYAQIAPFYSKREKPTVEEEKVNPFVPYLREAQLKDLNLIPNAGMAVLTDVGAERTIHPPYKQEVANRLSAIALARNYGFKELAYQSPQYRSYSISGNKMILKFEHADGGLQIKSSAATNFEVAGEDQVFHPAKAVIDHDKIIVTADGVDHPVAARYGFSAWVKGDLFNGKDLPASSFRTDDWPLPNKQ